MNIDPNLAWMAAAAAAIVAGWRTIKAFIDWVGTLLIGKVEAQNFHVTSALHRFLWYECKQVKLGSMATVSYTVPFKDGRRDIAIFQSLGNTPSLFLYGKTPLMAYSEIDKTTHEERIVIRYVRGTLDPDAIMVTARNALKACLSTDRFRVQRMAGSFGASDRGNRVHITESVQHDQSIAMDRVMRCISHDHRLIGQQSAHFGLADLSLTSDTLKIVDEFRIWRTSEEWYRVRGIPWRRGLLLHGQPGTGKTTLARAMAVDLDMPIYAIDLATCSNNELSEFWQEACNNAPCMILLEDLDSVFNGRESLCKTMHGNLTFDCLLNCISGAGTNNGVLTCITTNHLDKLDPAIYDNSSTGTMSRPGRVDRIIHVGKLPPDALFKIARRIFADAPDHYIRRLVDAAGDVTAAQFTETCIREALQRKFSYEHVTS